MKNIVFSLLFVALSAPALARTVSLEDQALELISKVPANRSEAILLCIVGNEVTALTSGLNFTSYRGTLSNFPDNKLTKQGNPYGLRASYKGTPIKENVNWFWSRVQGIVGDRNADICIELTNNLVDNGM